MISLSKGTGKKKGETNEEKDFGKYQIKDKKCLNITQCFHWYGNIWDCFGSDCLLKY